MTSTQLFLLITASLVVLVLYLAIGMSRSGDKYSVNGWVFAPARWLKRFLCGMFIGHEYQRIDFGYQCKHCLKEKPFDSIHLII